MFGGSTRMIRAEGTRTISASRSTIPCHFRIISAGTGVSRTQLALHGARQNTHHRLVSTSPVRILAFHVAGADWLDRTPCLMQIGAISSDGRTPAGMPLWRSQSG